jgi:mannosyltransferase
MVALELSALAAVVGLAAVLRLTTLDVQSFDFDELYTVWVIGAGLGDVLPRIDATESTPPLFYLVAFGWKQLLGTGEAGLRSLSALFGIATVPVVYAATREIASRRAALISSGLVAVSPWLVWHGQQARAYALVVLLSALSLLFFLRALREPRPRWLAAWALASSLALASHYFAGFLVGAEAAWLVLAVRSRATIAAIGVVAAAGVALAPLALDQYAAGRGTNTIETSGSLALRAAQVPKQSLVGFDGPAEIPLAFVACALAAVAFVMFARSTRPEERRRAGPALAVGAAAVALPLGLALAGADLITARNLIGAWPAAAVVAGIGLGAERAGRAGLVVAATLCAIFTVLTIATAAEPRYQREDWRGAAEALGAPARDRAIVLTPWAAPEPYAYYLPGLERMPAQGARVAEIAFIGIATVGDRPGEGRRIPPPPTRPPAAGFHELERHRGSTFTVVRFSRRSAISVSTDLLRRAGLASGRPAVLLQRRLRRRP